MPLTHFSFTGGMFTVKFIPHYWSELGWQNISKSQF
uniref:Uncharacterized protein n=1 Tax=Anguilla anguilla TaxID=7936 RepID=A0A0E9V3Y2_ANGAN